MIIVFEEDGGVDAHGYPTIGVLVRLAPEEKLTPALHHFLNTLRWSASQAWAIVMDEVWYGPIQ